MDEETLMSLIDRFVTPETKILGWGQMLSGPFIGWWTIKVCEEIIPKIKAKYPNLKIVMGGSGVHDNSYRYKNRTVFDYYLYGHAENTMLALCNHLYRGGKAPAFELLNGNRIVRETFADSILTEDEHFKITECSFRWHKNDCIQMGESLPLEISRGCIFKCKFCRYPYIGKTKNDFSKSIDNVIQEIEYNYDQYGTTNYYMLEDTFNDNNEKIKELHDRLTKLPFRINFACYLRADLIHAHDGQAVMLKEMGLISGFLGIETLGEESSKIIGKAWSGKHGKQYLKQLRDNIWGDETTFTISMLVGVPPDTKQDLVEHNKWFIDNGMHNWKWGKLDISRDIKGPWVSEFDRDCEKYGFKWITRYGKTIWKTDVMDEIYAFNIRNYLTSLSDKYQKARCWDLIERGSFGYDLHEEKNKIISKSSLVENMKTKRTEFLQKYINDLRNISMV
jgi:radical SAM superfamily enzyme YgiQ (UPF0313 family)